MIEVAKERNPFQRLTTTADVADAIVALSRPGTHWMTGNVIGVDGGEDVVG
ncbi:MAG: SDR family oxidoreductase [Candidatus Methylomirabilales bacterium]